MNHSTRLIIPIVAAMLSFSFAQDVPRDLVERIVGGSRNGEFLDFTVGTLPANLPFSLTLSEEVETVGSYTERWEEIATTTLYLTTEAPKRLVQQDLIAQLQLAGLELIPQGDTWNWGFASSSQALSDIYEFCRDDLLVMLFFEEVKRTTNVQMTDVEVRLEDLRPERRFDCEQRSEHVVMRDEHAPPVPLLSAPTERQTFDVDFGRTFAGEYSAVALEGGLDLGELTEHYAAQLEAAGWAQMESSATPSVVWTQWRFEGAAGSWIGFMQVLGDEVFPEQTIAYLFVVQM